MSHRLPGVAVSTGTRCARGGAAALAIVLSLTLLACAGARRPVVSERAVAAGSGEESLPEAVQPPEQPGEPELGEGIWHVVRAGQTLWRIAHTYGVEPDAIAAANQLGPEALIETGQMVWIPGAPEPLDVVPAPAPLAKDVPDDVHDGLQWPVAGGTVLSRFGDHRRGHTHRGLDIGGSKGQEIVAAQQGTVLFNGVIRGYGKTVVLDHGGGLVTLYAHNGSVLVSKGDHVERGQTIALMGHTGNATTDHCHFEVRRGDSALDPLLFLGLKASR